MSHKDSDQSQFLLPLLDSLVKNLDSVQSHPGEDFMKRLREATALETALRQIAASGAGVLSGEDFNSQIDPVSRGFRRGRQQLEDPRTASFYNSLQHFPEIGASFRLIAAGRLIPERLVPCPPKRT